VLGLDLGASLERLGSGFQLVEPLQRDPSVEEGFAVQRVHRKRFVEACERFFGIAQAVQRNPAIDDRLGVERVLGEGTVVRVEGVFVAAQVIQDDATAHPRVGGVGLLVDEAVDRIERRFEAAHVKIVRCDFFECFRVKVVRRAAIFVAGNQIIEAGFADGVVEVVEAEIEHAKLAPVSESSTVSRAEGVRQHAVLTGSPLHYKVRARQDARSNGDQNVRHRILSHKLPSRHGRLHVLMAC
jgi:hypothetical protein